MRNLYFASGWLAAALYGSGLLFRHIAAGNTAMVAVMGAGVVLALVNAALVVKVARLLQRENSDG